MHTVHSGSGSVPPVAPHVSPCPQPFNLAAYVLASAARTPEKMALQIVRPSGAERWSFGRLEAAVDQAGRAVFWKEKGLVTRQVRLWDAPGIARVIQRLLEAERSSRGGRGLGELMVRHELLAIARQAARERA